MGVHYENGNLNTPVIVLGNDPSNEGNVLVSRLAPAVSVPAASVGSEEGTDEEGNAGAPVETETTTENQDDADTGDEADAES